MEKPVIKIRVEYGELNADIEGSAEEALKGVIQLLSRVLPAFEPLRSFTFSPDYLQLVEEISSVVKVEPQGQLVLLRRDLTADEALGAVLLGAHLADKVGKRPGSEVQLEELIKTTGKAAKTVQNTLPEMVKAGLVEKLESGTYRITPSGILEVTSSIRSLRQPEK